MGGRPARIEETNLRRNSQALLARIRFAPDAVAISIEMFAISRISAQHGSRTRGPSSAAIGKRRMRTDTSLRGRRRTGIARCSRKILRHEDGAERPEAGDQRSNAPRTTPTAHASEPLAQHGKAPLRARSV